MVHDLGNILFNQCPLKPLDLPVQNSLLHSHLTSAQPLLPVPFQTDDLEGLESRGHSEVLVSTECSLALRALALSK